MAELAAADAPRTVDQLAAAQHIPSKYLENILGELRRGGLLRSQRGPDGGTGWLGRRRRSASPT
jgi:DNA-binding IscR family transcriptional regulator